MEKSVILSCNGCYRLQPLTTALHWQCQRWHLGTDTDEGAFNLLIHMGTHVHMDIKLWNTHFNWNELYYVLTLLPMAGQMASNMYICTLYTTCTHVLYTTCNFKVGNPWPKPHWCLSKVLHVLCTSAQALQLLLYNPCFGYSARTPKLCKLGQVLLTLCMVCVSFRTWVHLKTPYLTE